MPEVANTSPSEISGGHSSLEYKSHLAEVSSSHGRLTADGDRCEDSRLAANGFVSWGIW